ncbi:MAG: IS66 family transposase [Coriobacteriales bacterium]|jgi:hypothetical protein|nr:IS66 family transposase [Coriobacteriales bacterium]
MRKNGYDVSGAEVRLRHQLAQAELKVSQLASDVTGAERIVALEAQVLTLEDKSKDRDALRIKCANLTAENKELKAVAKEQKAEIARLKADLALSYQMERDACHKLEKGEKARFEWTEKARTVALRLSEALAQHRSLKAKLSRNCDNSSIPPSACPNAKKTIHNSRVKTDRRPGGQPGHVGHKRKARVPDRFVRLVPPDACPYCSGVLKPDGTERSRQVTDVVITAQTVEYVAEGYICSCCDKQVYAPFPDGVVNEVNYGNNICAVATFLYSDCNVSKAKTASFLFEATGHELTLSQGSIHNFLMSFSKKAQGIITDIASEIKTSGIVGTDATHTRSEGAPSYVYNFNSPNSTIYLASAHKGPEPLNNSLLADYKGTVVHDHDMSYYNFGSGHAECNVHILRYLKGVCQNEPDVKWAEKMSALLCEANDTCKEAREADVKALEDDVIADIEARFDDIVAVAEDEYVDAAKLPAKYRPEGVALYKRLGEFKGSHLAFIHDLNIPFDNNRSERDLRCVKKKTKQTGGFRSTTTGEAPYCDYLSVTQTVRLKKMAVLKTVRDVFDGTSEVFKVANSPPG